MTDSSDAVLVVGAGLAGLVAANHLRQNGYKVIIFEAADVVGGRMATTQFGDGQFDSGAQFFTVRDERFGRLVEKWVAAGAADLWSMGFAGTNGRPRRDGHPRYRGTPGMRAIPVHLAQGLDVRLRHSVTAITVRDDQWRLVLEDGRTADGRALVLTPPLPQSLSLLADSPDLLPEKVTAQLEGILYDPCLALLVELDASSNVPLPGAVQLHGEPLTFIGDNTQKGVSPASFAVTIHAGPGFSREHWHAPDEVVANLMLDAADYWLGAPVRAWELLRWPYSIPRTIIEQRAMLVPGPPPLALAGDVFGGPRVEGAALSGLVAAESLLWALT